jgi:hypothetical protein
MFVISRWVSGGVLGQELQELKRQELQALKRQELQALKR